MHSLLPHPLWVFAPQTASQGNLSSLAYLKLQLLTSFTGTHFLFHISSNYCLHLKFYMGICTQSLQSCLPLCDPIGCSCQTPLSMGFSRQKYWSGLPCPPQGYSWSRDRTCIVLCLLHCRLILYPLSHLGSIIFCKHLCMYFAYWMPSSICPQWGLAFMIWAHRAPFMTKTFAWQQVDEAFDIFLLNDLNKATFYFSMGIPKSQ